MVTKSKGPKAKKIEPALKNNETDPEGDQLGVHSDPFEMAASLFDIALHFQGISEDFTHEDVQQKIASQMAMVNPWSMSRSLLEAGKKLVKNPSPLYQASQEYADDLNRLWQGMYGAIPGSETPTHVITPAPGDKRFKDKDWQEQPFFNFIQQNYLLWSRWLQDVTDHIEGLSPDEARKVKFYSRQLRDAMAPTNFFWMNPMSVRRTIETNGQNIIKGVENLMADMDAGNGQLNIEMVKRGAFEVGRNIATTPGQVVFQNDLIQLIHYKPTQEKNYKIPLVLVPPCINKYYIFDLRPENSFIKWALDQGYGVFMVSWVNPDHTLSHKSFENYVLEGVGEAVRVASEIYDVPKVNALGFCIGGNFLACLSGYYAGKDPKDNLLNSTTYLATLFDFKDPGDLRVFIDEKQLASLERQIKLQGFLDGRIMARTFNMLRANDLIWSFIINNYYLGESPAAFDMLYWNSDSTNLPAAMYTYYLRKFFLENKLIKKGGLTMGDQKIDLSQITCPTFVLNTQEDHIAPWKCGYAGAQIFGGPTEFVLGGSGHVAGIFNAPAANKYGYRVGKNLTQTPDQWLINSSEKDGSWWVAFDNWLSKLSGPKVDALKPGQHKKYPALEAAPGSFVKKVQA